jgi:DNA-directed RNA polymerase subunit K/omega
MTVEQLYEHTQGLHEAELAFTPGAPPITSRFLFVNVAAMRAKQLHRGARPRLDANHADVLTLGKAKKIAMQEVRCGLVDYTPETSRINSVYAGTSGKG